MPTGFETKIRELTKPINGQLPRPWMTELEDPAQADVFIVGMNPAHRLSRMTQSSIEQIRECFVQPQRRELPQPSTTK